MHVKDAPLDKLGDRRSRTHRQEVGSFSQHRLYGMQGAAKTS
jgi:hypothetical protein